MTELRQRQTLLPSKGFATISSVASRMRTSLPDMAEKNTEEK